jgi:quinol-cytochrome oxidoreductase complex cytochrome b subunit/mono/diheme cytochrome c family protein
MHAAQEQPSRSGFWEERTGWGRLKEVLLLEPVLGGSRWAAAFGSLLLFAFALQVVTGILLAVYYSPSVESAYPSVKFIQEEVPLGGFIRAVHHWGSSAMVILLLVHLVQVFVWGAYKRPREFTWMIGVLLLFCILGLAFTGYLLPWDQKAYWATKVGLGIASTVPLIGDDLRLLLQGGPQLGDLTLTRFFTIHGFLLPGLVIALVVIHLYLFRVHGVTPPWWQTPAEHRAAQEPFWPNQALKDGVFMLLFLIGIGLWCAFHPAPLEAEADPAQPYEARPEWYFMFLFRILKYFAGPYEVVGTFVLPAFFFLILFLWPFLDRILNWIKSSFMGWAPSRDPLQRPVAMTLLVLGTVGLVGLTIQAIVTDVRMEEPAVAAGRTPPPAERAGPLQRADVAQLYASTCTACHGVDGTGSQVRAAMPAIPDFTRLAWQLSQTDVDIVHRIQEGSAPFMPAYRDKLTQPQILALAIYVRAFSVAPTAPASPEPQGPPAPPSEAVTQAPAQAYRVYCLACHDKDGTGKTIRDARPTVPEFNDKIPNFADAAWQKTQSDAELKQSILDGKGKFMLPMKSKLSEAEAKAMVAYLRAFQGGKQVVEVGPKMPLIPATPEQPVIVAGPGKPSTPPPPATAPAETAARLRLATEQFRTYCMTCHGPYGRGTEMRASMPAIPDFASRAWQDTVTNPQLVASILNGKGAFMPPFQGRISEDQARDLVAYVRSFSPTAAVQPVAGAPGSPAAAASDFEKRYRELQDQWNELQRQMNELSRPPRKP